MKANIKEPIRLRQKPLSNGSVSLYLDLYRNGKREYEFLQLYLIPPTDAIAKERNKQTLLQANAIKAQRIYELTNNEKGLKNKQQSKILLSEWLEYYKQTKNGKSESLRYMITETANIIREMSPKIQLCNVDAKFCECFLRFLRSRTSYKTKLPLTESGVFIYFRSLNGALNLAVRNGLIEKNAFAMVANDHKPRKTESQREYLTIDELKQIERYQPTTPIHAKYKQAFLFACFCGLRISDVSLLRWENIKTINGNAQIEIRQKKTTAPLYLPLSNKAMQYLPTTPIKKGLVFPNLNNKSANRFLQVMSNDLGLTKKITFHVSRHTFATTLLTKGADLYTTCKLLGHKNINTTQIYAKIIDQKKTDAVNLLNDI